MDFRIANTFTDSLGKLTGAETKAVKQAVFDFQVNPANPGLQQHRIEKTKDKHFWSVRVNKDVRIVVHRTDRSVLLCYVGHHDVAYRWAQRRKLEMHPRTGAAQLVVIEETTRKEVVPTYVEQKGATTLSPLFEAVSVQELLGYGVPQEWVERVRAIVSEGELLGLFDTLPEEAMEALLTLAEGKTPEPSLVQEASDDPYAHPDALRRFRIMENAEELAAALKFPWEKWTVFLHPAQRSLVEKDFNGPARVSGSAGTGKTIVALHRAAELAKRYSDSRVLLTTYSETLAMALKYKLLVLETYKPHVRERVEIRSIREMAERLYRGRYQNWPGLLEENSIQKFLREAASLVDQRFSNGFIYTEWRDIVDGWQVESLEDYLTVERLGRKRRLAQAQREILWQIFQAVKTKINNEGLMTEATMYRRVREALEGSQSPFDLIVVDEAQDLSVQQLRLLSVLGTTYPESLFFAGDMGQRIFQLPFSWRALDVDIRGRGRTLKVNYRTSHQIRRQADYLLDPRLRDVDGEEEDRSGTISVFDGTEPTKLMFDTKEEEIQAGKDWLINCLGRKIEAEEICITTRDGQTLTRAIQAVSLAGLEYVVLDNKNSPVRGKVSVCEMEQIKGLEFRAVAVMACDDEVIPSQKRIDTAAEGADIEEIYNTERRLLYVACTRARDQLLVTATKPESEFFGDLNTN